MSILKEEIYIYTMVSNNSIRVASDQSKDFQLVGDDVLMDQWNGIIRQVHFVITFLFYSTFFIF